ncbi:helix-turn-helix domain-containing protein [Dyadobacter sp. CY261]|uniref:helix-turn-helix domain-containing protein n=1 Tax=Dyadobacter sp. CY261 TaxID=2907203 RepID=UPI001F2A3623|nr:helix-turn-helix transcriptional regulator [Dyadobacter sp. CY261]MCF0075227.1 helix-turn-helix domain-containing protein [Dyadobacter sp. CY261]
MKEDRDLSRLKEIGLYLKELRNQAGLSQDELAAKCDLTKSNISNIENGKKDYFFTTFLEYAKGLEMHPQALLAKDFDFISQY